MLFDSFGYFLLFLPVAVITIRSMQKYVAPIAAQVTTLAFSILFYSWSGFRNLWYLAASIVLNWLVARAMDRSIQPARLRWLQLGLAVNLAVLCSFKYSAALVSGLAWLQLSGKQVHASAMPVGLSFFTITQITYLVDTYESSVSSGSLFDHALFVSFFPYVLSGPIAKAKRMRRQFATVGAGPFAGDRVARGLYLFSLGIFKKAVLAAAFAQVSTYGFDTARSRSALEVTVFAVSYTMQIYFDFSGYSDMAIGTAEMLGMEIPRNFDAPLRSRSIIEFWQRWHISLSSFITTYMYTPLLRKLRSATLTASMVVTVLVMAVAGVWHGAAWTFVCFGLLHGVALAVNSLWRKKSGLKLPSVVAWVLTFGFVNGAFVFFRASGVGKALQMCHELAGANKWRDMSNLIAMRGVVSLPIFGVPLLLGLFIAFYGKSSEQLARDFKPGWQSALISGVLFVTAAVYLNSELSPAFIYFRF